ncbi:hypothetical protein HanPSC8_Chr06g0241921 [Helianthus annuus]|nr:hypothetical protein HanPSC8_Chr06g0241921 [Helianthus annuus]
MLNPILWVERYSTSLGDMEIWNEHMFKPYNTKRFRNLYACFWVLVLLLG